MFDQTPNAVRAILAVNPLASLQQAAFALNLDEEDIQAVYDRAKQELETSKAMQGIGDERKWFVDVSGGGYLEYHYKQDGKATGISVSRGPQNIWNGEYCIYLSLKPGLKLANAGELGFEVDARISGQGQNTFYVRKLKAPLEAGNALAECSILYRKADVV